MSNVWSTHKKLKKLKNRDVEKIETLKTETWNKFDSTSKEVNNMKSYVNQMCDMMKITTTETIENEIGRVSEVFEKVKDELVEKTDNILKKNKKSISNIKNTCATFFDKYDQALQFMQRRFDNINQTFSDYEQNTIQPVQVREARLHYIESQLKEQESSREIEFDHLKELIMKLLTALEQSVFISGTDCIAISKRVNVKRLNKNYSKVNSPRNDSFTKISKTKISGTHISNNRSMIQPTGDSFLPSLSRNVHNESSIIQHKDENAIINEHDYIRNTSLNSKHSDDNIAQNSPKKQNMKAIRLNGDKNLLKRLLFLKQSLDRNPHLKEKEDLQSQFMGSQMIDPVVIPIGENGSKLIRVEEPPTRKNFFQTPKSNSVMGFKKSQSAIRSSSELMLGKKF